MSESGTNQQTSETEKEEPQLEDYDINELEINFQTVLEQIYDENALKSFKEQYEILHTLLIASHQKNQELLKRCQQLNNQILSNSTKVSSILQMSQEDEKTISGLRYEFEKAWKMVEISQDSENKKRDIVDGLKAEVARLKKAADAGSNYALEQESSIKATQEEIDEINKEIKQQNDQINALKTNIENSTKSKDEATEILNQLKESAEQLEKDITEARNETRAISTESSEKLKEMSKSKQDIAFSQEDLDKHASMFKDKKDNIEELNHQYFDERKNLREEKDNKENLDQKIKLAREMLNGKKEMDNKINDHFKKANKKAIETDAKLDELKKTLEKVSNENKDLTTNLNELKEERREATQALAETQNMVNTLRNEILSLRHDLITKGADITNTTRKVSLEQLENRKARNDVSTEKRKFQSVEGQKDGIINELLAIKAHAHNNRMKADQIKTEIENYYKDSHENKTNLFAVQSDIESNETLIAKADLDLRDKQDRITKQISLERNAMQQRDLVVNQIITLKSQSTSLEEDNLNLEAEIRALKSLIREKDVICVETHVTRKKIENQLMDLENDKIKLQATLQDVIKSRCTLENQIMRSRYLHDTAINDLTTLKRANMLLESQNRLLDHSVHKKDKEYQKLNEKAVILSQTLRSRSSMYSKLTNEIHLFKENLTHEVEKAQSLKNKCDHYPILRKEEIRLEKIKIEEQGKARALEEELQTPMLIHRWRFLQGTNPEVYQMIKVTHDLKGKYMFLLARLQRLSATKKLEEEKLERKKHGISRTSHVEYEESTKYLGNLLKQKNKQLQQFSEKIDGQQETVNDCKSNLATVRNELRDAKLEYYLDKGVTDKMRSKSQAQKKNEIKVPPFTRSKSRFVGGGFPIDVQHSLDTVRRPQPIISVGGPIIIPKVGSSNATGNITNQKNQSQRTVHLPRQPLKSLRMPVDEWTVGH